MDLEPTSVRYVVVVTAGPLCSQTHDRGLWGRITEPGVVLTPTAVSRVGIKIWHPWRSNTDTSWAWSQRKCLSPPYINTAALSPPQLWLSHLLLITPSSLYHYSKHFPFTVISVPLLLQPLPVLLSIPFPQFVLSPPTCETFPVTHRWFSANFSSPLEHQFLWHSSSWLLWWLHVPLLGLVVVNWSREWELLRVTSAVFAAVG